MPLVHWPDGRPPTDGSERHGTGAPLAAHEARREARCVLDGAELNIERNEHDDSIKLAIEVLADETAKRLPGGGFVSDAERDFVRCGLRDRLAGQPESVIKAACEIVVETFGDDALFYYQTWNVWPPQE